MTTIEAHLIDSFILVNRFFQKHKIRYCLIGGIAAGYWGEPRYTKDMDFTVAAPGRKTEKFRKLLEKERFSFEEKGASQLQIHSKGKLKFIADVIFAEMDYQEWVLQRARPVKIFEIPVPICSAEDLLILKLIANRRQDLLDIENVLRNNAEKMDWKYLKEWFSTWELTKRFVEEFGKDYQRFLTNAETRL